MTVESVDAEGGREQHVVSRRALARLCDVNGAARLLYTPVFLPNAI